MIPHDRLLPRAVLPILGLVLIPGWMATNYTQTDCVEPPFGYQTESWAPGTEVTVNIDPKYNEQQRKDIKAAFDNWTAASGPLGNRSNVQFVTFTYNPVNEDMPTSPNTVNVIRVSGRNLGQTRLNPGVSRLSGANMFVPECKTENRTDSNILEGTIAHEVGHTFGLVDCSDCTPGQSIMGPGVQSVAGDICSGVYPDPDNPGGFLSGPRPCDVEATKTGYSTPTPTPASETGAYCDEEQCRAMYGPRGFCDGTVCSERTPVLVDVVGDGFDLTDAPGGVDFDMDSDGARERVAWTAAVFLLQKR